jgi:pantoate--beta-alanine ligase
MSSRNERLSSEARKKAAIVFEILQMAKKTFSEKSILDTIAFVKNEFKKKFFQCFAREASIVL